MRFGYRQRGSPPPANRNPAAYGACARLQRGLCVCVQSFRPAKSRLSPRWRLQFQRTLPLRAGALVTCALIASNMVTAARQKAPRKAAPHKIDSIVSSPLATASVDFLATALAATDVIPH